jgi:general secretion pathway protein D
LSIIGLLFLAATGFAGCMATVSDDDSRSPDVTDRIRSMDLLPRFPKSQEAAAGQGDRRRPAVFAGSAESSSRESAESSTAGQSSRQSGVAPSGGGYDLNFENSPVTNVAKVILGDVLGLGYTIDPRVQGFVNLASARPVPRSDLLFVLEDALRLTNTALVRDTAGYRLVPLGEAIGAGNIDREAGSAEPGYGVSIVPMRHVSATTLLKLIDSFAMKPGAARVDPARNLLLIQGTGPERQAAIETALTFDADWMRGQSVGIYPVHNSAPEPVIAELEKIVDSGEGGLAQNLVKFQAIGRSNSILVVARRPALLNTVGTWIGRLDRNDNSPNGVRVYRVRYGEARQMARVLNDIFVGGGASSTLDAATNQIAPGSGALTATSGDQAGAVGGSPGGPFGAAFGAFSGSGTGRARQQLGGQQQDQRGLGGQQSPLTAAGPNATSATGDSRGGGAGGAPILSGIRITADAVNNSLLIHASQENYRIIERTIRQIDRPQMQVAIEATVAEVTLNNDLNYGVQFFLTSRDLGFKADKGSLLNTPATQGPAVDAAGVAGAFLNRALPGFNFLIGPEKQPRLILQALHALTSVKVLSNPSLVVIDNQPATLQVGDDVPISTGSATVLTTNNTVVNTIDYRNTGIILRVVPRINANGNIRLDIEQEISNVAPTAGSSTLTPTVSQRRVKSSISVASGQTVVLAGLISERQERGSSGLPFLDQLPEPLSGAFSSRTNATVRTELIIFIRPQIIRDSVDAHFVAEELRSKLRGTAGASPPSGPLTTKQR